MKMVTIDEIAPSPDNPREISPDAFEGLRASLARFGCIELMVVNQRTMKIVGGHQRYKVLRDAGVKRVPVILVDLDKTNARLLNISLNNPAIQGAWTSAVIKQLEGLREQIGDEFDALCLDELRKEVSVLDVEPVNGSAMQNARDAIVDDIRECPRCGHVW